MMEIVPAGYFCRPYLDDSSRMEQVPDDQKNDSDVFPLFSIRHQSVLPSIDVFQSDFSLLGKTAGDRALIFLDEAEYNYLRRLYNNARALNND